MVEVLYNGTDGGAYHSSRYLAKAICKQYKSVIYYESFKRGADLQQGKGGILVLPTDVENERLYKYILELDKFESDNNLLGWTIGKYLNGRYTSPKNGKQYGENSLSVEIIGVDIDTLIKIAMEICSSFKQESVLVKDFSSGRVLFVNRD